jgi:hypothetical protein
MWIYVFVGATILSLGGLGVSLATRSVAGVVIVLAFSMVFGIVWIGEVALASRRGAGPRHLQGLEPDQRRLVSATVNSGAPCPDPRLAGVVVTHARLRQRITALYLLSLVIVAAARVMSLRSARGWEQTADVVALLLILVVAVTGVRNLVRAGRAITLNAGGGAPPAETA